ncbi:MAG TPA: protein kinase, partial [Pirellulales bacterium]|nr:protein kinase [Pirellulales bacterium]
LVLDKLGAGGMGQVFRARHRRMDRVVALKVLSKKQVGSPEAVARFQREVKAAARLTHPHIVTAYDADEAAGVHYLVMEYVDGQDLSEMVKAHGPMKVPQAVDFMIQAARGLEHAHSQGVIHRDVKPSNLLLDKHGTVKILDMGLARVDNPLAGPDSGEGLTAAGSVMGTVDFMSPEQALDTAQADARSDIYSLGYTLYYLLSGKKPYDGDTAMKKLLAHREKPTPSLAQDRPEVSADLEAVYRKMVAKRPEQRYANVREVREALEAVQAGRKPLGTAGNPSPVPVAARISELPERPSARKKQAKKARSKTPLVAAAVGIVLLVGVGSWVAMQMGSNPSDEQVAVADAAPKQVADKPASQNSKATSQPTKQASSVPPSSEPASSERAPPKGAAVGPKAGAAAPTIPGPAQPAMNQPQGAAAADDGDRLDSAADGGAAAEQSPADLPPTPADPAVERSGAEWVLSAGGKVEIFANGRTMKILQASELPKGAFTVTLVDLTRSPECTDEGLARLDGLSHVITFSLGETPITNAAAEHLARHEWLKALNLPSTAFTDEGVEQLAPLTRLELFRANQNALTDRAARALAQHKSLRDLFLQNVLITDAGLAALSQLPLDHLHVEGSQITDAGVKELQKCQGLTVLGLDRTAITDESIKIIGSLPLVHWLSLRDTRITEQSVDTLVGMKSLTILHLSDPPISKSGFGR